MKTTHPRMVIFEIYKDVLNDSVKRSKENKNMVFEQSKGAHSDEEPDKIYHFLSLDRQEQRSHGVSFTLERLRVGNFEC